MSKVKKDHHTDDKPEVAVEPVSLTNHAAAKLAQSFSTIVEHVARIATVYHGLAGSAAHGELSASITAAAANATESLEVLETALNASPKKRKRDRDPDAPKRPGSSFLMFAGDRRDQLKKAHPELSNAEVMRELGNQWRDASSSVREPYERKYATEIDNFKRKTEEYTSGKTTSGSPPTKVSKTSKSSKKSAPLSSKAGNKSTARSSDSESNDSDANQTSASKTSKSKKTTKTTKTTKPSKVKDSKKSSTDDKKSQSTKKASSGKKADATSSKSDKKTKKKKSAKA